MLEPQPPAPPSELPSASEAADAAESVTPADAPPAPGFLTGSRLDRLEQIFVVTLYGTFVFATIEATLQRPTNAGIFGAALGITAELITVVFALIRRPTERVTPRLSDWGLALGATLGPMLTRPIPVPADWTPGSPSPFAFGLDWALGLSVALRLLGTCLQIGSKLALGRSFGILPADRGLAIAGPYRYVRHPIYLGYALSHVGLLIFWPTWWNLAVIAATWALQIPRLLVEEQYLASTNADYRNYQESVRYRLIPGVF